MTVNVQQKQRQARTELVKRDHHWVGPNHFVLDPVETRSTFSDVPYTFASIVTDSVNSPNYFVKVARVVPSYPKKVMKEPTMPMRRRRTIPVIPTKRPKQSKRSFDRVMRRYRDLRSKYDTLVERDEHLFQLRMAKYDRVMNLFIAQQIRIKHGRVKKVRVRNEVVALIENPYSRVISYYEPMSGSIMFYDTVTGLGPKHTRYVGWEGDLGQFFTRPWAVNFGGVETREVDSCETHVRSKLQKKLNDSNVHVANMIAERQQSVDMLRDALKRLLRYVVRFSWKNVLNDVKDYLSVRKNKTLANDTLAFLFGAKPLIQDIYGIGTELHKKAASRGDLVEVGASAKKEQRIQTTINGVEYDVFIQTKVKYKLKYLISNPAAYELQNLGLVNPAELLWEKLPWSFVIDWVWPIGSWIRGITNTVGLSFQTGSRVVTQTISIKSKIDSIDVYPPWWAGQEVRIQRGKGVFVVNRKNRQILTASPENILPAFKNPLSVTHIIEALALFRQQLRR